MHHHRRSAGLFLALALACPAAAQEKPLTAKDYCERGIAYARKGDYDRAIADYTEAVRLDPSYGRAYYDRGAAYGRKRDFDRAILDFTMSIGFDPRQADAYCNRGLAYLGKKDHDRALADCNEALRLDPKIPLAFHTRAAVYAARKDYGQAVAGEEQAGRRDKNFSDAYRGLAWLRATSPKEGVRDGRKALEAAQVACRLTADKDAGCLEALAAAHAERGDFAEAVRCQQKAAELEAGDPVASEKARARLERYRQGKPYREE